MSDATTTLLGRAQQSRPLLSRALPEFQTRFAQRIERSATPSEVIGELANASESAPPALQRAYLEQTLELLSVTPDAFMALLERQVRREDEKVLDAQNAIQRSITESRGISQRMEVLQKIHQRLSQESDGKLKMDVGTIDLNGETMTLGEAVVRYDLMDELNLTDRVDPSDPEWFHDIRLRADAVQSAIEVLRQEQQQVTSGNEMNMIAMQQAMQQRGQHLQLVSKLLAMMGDTERAIVGNMR